MILPQTAFSLGLAILLFRRFFKQLPTSLLDAAMIDGCGYTRFFWHVTLPLSRPILATVGVFVFVQSWNNYLLPLVVLNWMVWLPAVVVIYCLPVPLQLPIQNLVLCLFCLAMLAGSVRVLIFPKDGDANFISVRSVGWELVFII